MPRTSKSKEEVQAANRLYQRERYKRIKNNPELYKIQKEKDRRKYEEQKKKKIRKSILELNRRDQKAQRAKWRANSKKYLEKKRKARLTEQVDVIDKNEPLEDDLTNFIDPLSSSQSTPSSKPTNMINKIRYRMKRERNLAQKTIAKLQAENRKLKNIIIERNRAEETEKIMSTLEVKDPKKVELKNIANPVNNIAIIHKFYHSNLNSYCVTGKNQFIKKLGIRKPKRYLCDTLRNLYKKFKIVYPQLKVSYPTFCRNRPFNICFPKSSRNTCLCKIHTNMQLLITALHKTKIIKEHNASQIISALCCHEQNINCLSRQCESCKQKVIQYLEFENNKNVVYYEWATKRVNSKLITTKCKITASPKAIILKFEEAIPKYLIHLKNIAAQHQIIRDLKSNLTVSEIIIHCDWSENYSLKYTEEVQSLHFGGSRGHVSLHTSVMYICDSQTGITTPRAFCTVSESLDHTSAGVWAHLMPLLRYIEENCPMVNTIHFLSDSPSSQYRNKFIFYIVSKLHLTFNQIHTISWNYTETGHGKGAPDGVGGALKTALDRRVNYGHDIGNYTDFLTAVKNCNSNIQVEVVTQEEINELKSLIPSNVPNFKGTMKIHQIFWDIDASVMAARSLSCFLCQCVSSPCMHGKHLGFIDIIKDQTAEAVSRNAITKKIFPESKKITVLSEIKINAQDYALLSNNLQSKPIPFIIANPKAYNVSSSNIAKDFEEMIDATAISIQPEPTPSTSFLPVSESLPSQSRVLRKTPRARSITTKKRGNKK